VKKELFLLMISSTLMFLWTIPENGNLEVDVFLFKDHLEKIKWVLHDTHIYLTIVILTYIIHRLAKRHEMNFYSSITFVFLCFSIFRLLEYFTFRGLIPMWPIVSGIILWSLVKIYNGVKTTNT
jgi:hypothetical protein